MRENWRNLEGASPEAPKTFLEDEPPVSQIAVPPYRLIRNLTLWRAEGIGSLSKAPLSDLDFCLSSLIELSKKFLSSSGDEPSKSADFLVRCETHPKDERTTSVEAARAAEKNSPLIGLKILRLEPGLQALTLSQRLLNGFPTEGVLHCGQKGL